MLKKSKIRNLPTVTLLIVVRNEINFIKKSIFTLLNQIYPKELTEIIIIDGMSTDGTREWIQQYIAKLQSKNINIKLLDNPEHILASGWNTGIKAANGDVVCRIDAHNEIDPDYISKGIDWLLKDSSIVCIGGCERNTGTTSMGRLIADLFSSKFGVGNAKYRIGLKRAVYTDTAKCGLYWKWVFEKLGYFNVNLARNQDLDLHKKITNSGYKFLTNPDMKLTYYVRSTLLGLVRKAYSDGYWIAFVNSFSIRHIVPFVFFIYVSLLLLLINIIALPVKWICSFPIISYFLLAIYFAIKDGKTVKSKLLLPILFLIFHLSYGFGTLNGFFSKLKLNLKKFVDV
jgi:glycosyltransferase involved in cell wall biosynthesis